MSEATRPVLRDGQMIGLTVRASPYEVWAVLCGAPEWDRPDHMLGVFRDRKKVQQAVKAMLLSAKKSQNKA